MQQQFTDEEILKEAEREVKQRLHVYKGQVARGSMTKTLADRRIALMQAVVVHFRERTEQPALFRAAPAAPAPTVTAERLMKRFSDLAGRSIGGRENIGDVCEEIETRAKAQSTETK